MWRDVPVLKLNAKFLISPPNCSENVKNAKLPNDNLQYFDLDVRENVIGNRDVRTLYATRFGVVSVCSQFDAESSITLLGGNWWHWWTEPEGREETE